MKVTKQTIALIIFLTVIAGAFSACGSTGVSASPGIQEYTANKEYLRQGMLNLAGQPFDYENGNLFDSYGFGFVLTPAMQEDQTGGRVIPMLVQDSGFLLAYLTEKGTDSTQEEYLTKVMGLYRITENDSGSAQTEEVMDTHFEYKELLAAVGGDMFYVVHNSDFSSYELTDNDNAILERLLGEKDSFLNGVCVFPVEKAVMHMNDFDAETVDGGVFSHSDFQNYDITMVNIWATWCNPCVSEMPDLQKLYEKLPDGVNLISVCEDAATDMEFALEIIEQTGVRYKALIPDEGLRKSLISGITAFPTTIFVDKKGNLIGEAVIGVPRGDDVSEAYLSVIYERMEMAGLR